jgi:hypothetical protein
LGTYWAYKGYRYEVYGALFMSSWRFLTPHARALLHIERQPDARLRDIASAIGITERTAFGILTDLADAGYVVKERDGRRNRYLIQDHLPLPDAVGQDVTIGEVLGRLNVIDFSLSPNDQSAKIT